MTNLRDEAKGQPCMVRGPTCNYNPETTVLAHYRSIGISGIGLKSPDLLGAWACSNCHDLIDQRQFVEGFDRKDVQLLHLQGRRSHSGGVDPQEPSQMVIWHALRDWWRLRRIEYRLSRYSPEARAALLELAGRGRQ